MGKEEEEKKTLLNRLIERNKIITKKEKILYSEAWQSSDIRCCFYRFPFFSGEYIRPFPCSFSVTNSSLALPVLARLFFIVRGNKKKDTCSLCVVRRQLYAPCCASSLLFEQYSIVTQFQSNNSSRNNSHNGIEMIFKCALKATSKRRIGKGIKWSPKRMNATQTNETQKSHKTK